MVTLVYCILNHSVDKNFAVTYFTEMMKFVRGSPGPSRHQHGDCDGTSYQATTDGKPGHRLTADSDFVASYRRNVPGNRME